MYDWFIRVKDNEFDRFILRDIVLNKTDKKEVKEYLLASHYDKNDIHKKILEEINIPSYLFLEMNCDDGTGAAMGMSLIDASLHVLNDMKTFGEAEVAIAQDGPGALKQSKAIK